MAPQTMTSSQELLAQAAEKLSSAITGAGAAPNDFAMSLLELLEVSTKINQFDEMASAAEAETASDEAQKWREISLMTMQHARAHLVEQQQRLIEQLRGSSESGASLFKNAIQTPEVKPAITAAVKPASGLPSPVKPAQKAVQPPPGLATPPGLPVPSKAKTASKPAAASPPKLSLTVPARGLRPPPGLASAGTAAPVSPPPGFSFQKGQKQKKAGYAQKPQQLSFFEARFGKETTTPVATPAVMNIDAYESD